MQEKHPAFCIDSMRDDPTDSTTGVTPPGPSEPVGSGPLTGRGATPRGLDLINGPVFKTTLLLAGPVIASHLLNLALGIADMMMVGRLGTEATEALTALVLSNQLLMLLFAIGWGTGFAVITHVSRHTGAGKHDLARRSASHALMFGAMLGFVAIAIGNLFLPELIGLFNPEPTVARYAVAYSDVIFDFMPFFFLLMLGTAIMNGLGDTITPLIVMLFINALNIFLNYTLIFGAFGAPQLGIVGAAVGSVTARGLGSLIIILFLISVRYRMTLRAPDFRPIAREFWSILRLGIPNSLQSLLRNVNVILLYRILSLTYLPTVAQASLGVGFHAEALAFIPLIGLFIASGAMVGQNLGAGKTERAEQSAWAALKAALALMLVACVAFLTIPELIIRLFTDNLSVIHSGAWYLRINAIPQIFQSCFVLIGCLRGAGDSISPLRAHIIGNWIIRLPIAYLLARYSGLEEWGVWLAMAASAAIEGMIYYWLFRRGAWKTMRV